MIKLQTLKRKSLRILISCFTVLMGIALLNSCYYDNEEYLYPSNGQQTICDTLSVTYTTDIAPIFANYCNGCHNPSSPSGTIVTNSYPLLKANMDKVWASINWLPGAIKMPQSGAKLPVCELAKINRWRQLNMPNN